MALTRWDPFRELSIMQERMNRIFDDAGRGWRGDEPSATTSWSPAVDIYETENEIMVQAELPGVPISALRARRCCPGAVCAHARSLRLRDLNRGREESDSSRPRRGSVTGSCSTTYHPPLA